MVNYPPIVMLSRTMLSRAKDALEKCQNIALWRPHDCCSLTIIYLTPKPSVHVWIESIHNQAYMKTATIASLKWEVTGLFVQPFWSNNIWFCHSKYSLFVFRRTTGRQDDSVVEGKCFQLGTKSNLFRLDNNVHYNAMQPRGWDKTFWWQSWKNYYVVRASDRKRLRKIWSYLCQSGVEQKTEHEEMTDMPHWILATVFQTNKEFPSFIYEYSFICP